MIERLAHRNANVQLYTLELAYALSQNCGTRMTRELASRSFTDALLRLAGDRNTHQAVKAKVLEKMSDWTAMFSINADLGIMEQAYNRLKSTNPRIHAPSKPNKRVITNADREKEEEELQIALAISLNERQQETTLGSTEHDSPQTKTLPLQVKLSPVSHTTAATVPRVRALYDFVPSESGELAFRKGDIIAVLESVYKDWWKGSLRGQTGIFPLNYVEKLRDPTPEEMQRESQMEVEVFGQIKNVEKLLALLSTSSDSNVQDNDEITTLYHSTLAIRPKLIELIGKYSQKKDDFMALNERFIKARKDYESLLETSMSQTSHYVRTTTPYGYVQNGSYLPPSNSPKYYTHNLSISPSGGGGPYTPTHEKSSYGNAQASGQYYPPEGAETTSARGIGFHRIGVVGADAQTPGMDVGTLAQYPPSSDTPIECINQPQELSTPVYDTPVESRPPNGVSFVGEAKTHPSMLNFRPDRPLSPSSSPGPEPRRGYQTYNAQQRPLSAVGYPSRPPVSPARLSTYSYPALGTGTAPSGDVAYHSQSYVSSTASARGGDS